MNISGAEAGERMLGVAAGIAVAFNILPLRSHSWLLHKCSAAWFHSSSPVSVTLPSLLTSEWHLRSSGEHRRPQTLPLRTPSEQVTALTPADSTPAVEKSESSSESGEINVSLNREQRQNLPRAITFFFPPK